MVVFMGAKWGKDWCDIDPKQTRFYLWGFLCLYQFWRTSIKKCDCESAHRRIHTQTDANRFYNLSHAICYRYGANNKYTSLLSMPHHTSETDHYLI